MICQRSTRAAIAAFAVASVVASGCAAEFEGPYVATSTAPDPGGRVVAIPRSGGWGTPCLVVEVGQTVEWRNFAPQVPVNVTSLGVPPELFSPSLVPPLPTTGRDAKDGAYVYWRHTFAKPGVYEYYDTNGGESGKKVADPYYGTVTYVGLSAQLDTGIVCVKAQGSKQCHGICCTGNAVDDGTFFEDECPTAQCCDATGKRCRLGSPTLQACSGKPAHRELKCFADGDCHSDQLCVIQPQDNHTCKVPSP
ncbi:MAG: hypothetical protein EXR79_07995 [Myxococcales bacterium]|nr:hypothetical protein [Myxococcales bacterium]